MAIDWKVVAVSEAAEPVLGGTPSRSIPEYWNGEISWITAKDVVAAKGRYVTEAAQTITIQGLQESAAKIMPTGTVVITARGTVGAIAQLGKEMAFNQTCYGFIPRKNVDQNFLFYALKAALSDIRGISYGTVFDTITMQSFDHLKILLPDLPEQRAIAHILGTLDDKIELNRRMNETLEAMARAIFKSWFVDFEPVIDNALRAGNPIPSVLAEKAARRRELLSRANTEGRDSCFPKHIAALFPDRFVDSELGPIPAGWKVVSLPKVIHINPPRSLRKGDIAPYLDMANMPMRGHTPVAIIERTFGSGMRFINGDTLLARITPCLENGKTAYVDFLAEGQVGWGSTEYIVLCPKPPLPSEFGYCLARSTEFREFAIQSMTGTSGRQRVPAEALSYYLLAAPPEGVAKLFGKFIRPLFLLTRSAAKESRILTALCDTLLPKLISGELRVKDMGRFSGNTV
jgi:type I restriction enzyme S subunit